MARRDRRLDGVRTKGSAELFRSQERPRAFLVPVSDYEVLELKETRMVLKTGTTDRANIKISGGREAGGREGREAGSREAREGREARPEPAPRDETLTESRPAERPFNKREKRRRGRRGRDRDRNYDQPQSSAQGEGGREHPPEPAQDRQPPEDHLSPDASSPEAEKAPSFISKLFPPPPTLIKESLGRYKPPEGEPEVPLDDTAFEPPRDKEYEDEDEE
jgi:hypothetical protein